MKEHHEEFGWAELKGKDGSLLGIAGEDQENPLKAGSNAVVTVSVDDIEIAKTHFSKLGAKLVGETIEVPGHVKVQTFMDTDGNTLQLVQELI